MDKQKAIAALAQTPEDTVLLAKVYDKITTGQRRNIPASTCFLTGREQVLVRQLFQRTGVEEPLFFGGNESAERAVCLWLPDYLDPEEYLNSEDSPVAALRAAFSQYDAPGHRDFLGSLMGQGIKRETLGDLHVGDQACDFLVLREMVQYLLQNLFSAGRAHLTVTEIPLGELNIPQQQKKEISTTVSTLRLDSIVASGFQKGRGYAADCITSGRTEVNHMPVVKPDKLVSEGDVISVRGLGKIRVAEVRGNTKKGRIAVTLEKYL